MSVYTPSFTKQFSDTIWKIIADPVKGLLYVETRNGVERKVLFHAIDLFADKELWGGVSILDPWWSSLKFAGNGNVLLVKFNDPEMPEQRGMVVVNGTSGKPMWGKEEAQVIDPELDGIVISEGNKEGIYLKVNWENGNPIKELSLKELMTARNKKGHEALTVLYPFHFEEENSFFSKIQEYIKIITTQMAVRMIEYLEKGDKVLISYYIYEEEKLSNYMLVADENGHQLLHEKMQGGLNGIGMDTFFVLKDQLIIIKNTNELQAYVVK